MINILILSAGTRDKVVQYFKEALAGKGKVIATDCSPYGVVAVFLVIVALDDTRHL